MSSAVDTPRGLEAIPMTQQPVDKTTQSSLKIRVHRVCRQAKVPLAQLTPIIAEVDTFPTHLQVQLANAQWKEPGSKAGDAATVGPGYIKVGSS